MRTRALFLFSLLILLTMLASCAGVTSPPTNAAVPPAQTAATPTAPATTPTTTPAAPPPSTSPTPPPATSSKQLLYVVLGPNNTSMNTYAVGTDGSATQVGSTANLSARADLVQLTADHRHIYTYGSGATNATIAVYTTDASGAPVTPAVQTVTVPMRTGFLIHPSGRFAYEMRPGTSDYLSIQSSLYLQAIDATTGALSGNVQLLQSFCPTWTAELLSRFSKDGSTLFDEIDGSGPHATDEVAFRKSAVDPSTGALKLGNVFWDYNVYNDPDTSRSESLGNNLLAFSHIDGVNAANSSIEIYAVSDAASSGLPPALVQCNASMLAICAATTDVRLHPSEQFVFATDSAPSRVRVMRIDLTTGRLVDTGNSIARTQSDGSVTFSADGTLVYAPTQSDTAIQIYGFDAITGALTPSAVIPVGATFWMFPAP